MLNNDPYPHEGDHRGALEASREKEPPMPGLEFKLKLKDQGDDTYVLAIEEKGKVQGVYVVVDLRGYKTHPLGVVSRLQSALMVLQEKSIDHYIETAEGLVFDQAGKARAR